MDQTEILSFPRHMNKEHSYVVLQDAQEPKK